MSVGTARHLLRSEPPMIAIRYTYGGGEVAATECTDKVNGRLLPRRGGSSERHPPAPGMHWCIGQPIRVVSMSGACRVHAGCV